MEMPFETPTVIYLIGPPGVGKYTTASEIARLCDAVVVDNQLVNMPIFALFNWDETTVLPKEIWDHISIIRESVLSAIETITPRSLSYVMTNVLEIGDEKYFDRMENLARIRNSLFLPVLLTCDYDVEVERVTSDIRKERFKLSDAKQFHEFMSAHDMLEPAHKDLMRIDTTHTTPAENAFAIITRARELSEKTKRMSL